MFQQVSQSHRCRYYRFRLTTQEQKYGVVSQTEKKLQIKVAWKAGHIHGDYNFFTEQSDL